MFEFAEKVIDARIAFEANHPEIPFDLIFEITGFLMLVWMAVLARKSGLSLIRRFLASLRS